ncbi:HEPN domain-containing protein, partial [Candidatus Pacearchaeota archaeon]|nr:HEPN domain-containing protein [Candidatus Pacearchaeota archaeon]
MLSEEEQRKILENFSNEEILEIVNSALPKKSQIDQAKGDLLIPEAKKLMFLIQKEKGFSDEILLAKEFISLAKKDLETGNQRYKKQDFPTAIYHLQQATEKITKGYGLAQGIFTKKD